MKQQVCACGSEEWRVYNSDEVVKMVCAKCEGAWYGGFSGRWVPPVMDDMIWEAEEEDDFGLAYPDL